MAFGRSNSLSINTGATNSLLRENMNARRRQDRQQRREDVRVKDIDQQQSNKRRAPNPAPSRAVPRPAGAVAPTLLAASNDAPTTAPVPVTIVFQSPGNSSLTDDNISSQQNQTTQPPAPSGGLFSRITTSQPQQSSGLFGNTASNTQQNTGSGLFGATQNQPNQQQPQQTGGTGLFGATTNQPNQQQQQTGTSSLFGGSTANKPSGGLFGASTTNNASSGGLFGGNTGSSLFGGANTQQNQQQPSTGLFGASTQQQQPSTGLFGASTQQRPTSNLFGASTQQQPTNSLFGAANQQNQQQQAPTSTFLGMTATAPGANQNVSLLGNSQFRDPQIGSFAGRLTLGQPSNQATAGTTQGATGTGAVQVNYDTMKSTTRFNDLIPEVQQALERIDNMIRFQEDFCRQIEAFIPNHGPAVDSLKPDVEFIAEKAEAAETALALDAQGVQSEKSVLRKDIEDGERLQKVVENLKHPIQYHVRGDDAASKDLDLISHFFQPLTNDMSNTLSVYANAIAEVEGHMSILEASVLNAGARIGRAGGGNEGVGSVRELAETLGAFEEGILGAAGLVGECREGVNSLVLGR